jgi:hypothetical protein
MGATGGSIAVGNALHHAVPGEYVPFMSLLFALYVIAGGIRIETPFDGKPSENLSILALGAVGIVGVVRGGRALLALGLLSRDVLGHVEVADDRAILEHDLVGQVGLGRVAGAHVILDPRTTARGSERRHGQDHHDGCGPERGGRTPHVTATSSGRAAPAR